LGAILSNADAAELLLESESPPLDEVRKILADIRSDDLRASDIIRHIRLLIRKQVMQMEPLDVSEVAGEVVRLMEARPAVVMSYFALNSLRRRARFLVTECIFNKC
jgi:hypothetical protein